MFLKKYSKVLGPCINSTRLQYNSRFQFIGGSKFDSRKNYYETLGVSKDVSESQLKREYYKLAKIYHPDHNKGHQSKFKQINQAYQVLSDKNLRMQYNQSRIFGSFTENMGRRASSGNYHYQDYKQSYRHQFTPEEQEMIRQQMRKMARNAILFGMGLVLFSMIFMRSPNRFYNEVGGKLVPVDPHSVGIQMSNPYAGTPYGGYPVPPQYGGAAGNYQNRGPQQFPQNQGYGNQGYTQYSAPPYQYPPNQNYQQPPSSYPRNQQEANYNPRMQSNYQNRPASAPSD